MHEMHGITQILYMEANINIITWSQMNIRIHIFGINHVHYSHNQYQLATYYYHPQLIDANGHHVYLSATGTDVLISYCLGGEKQKYLITTEACCVSFCCCLWCCWIWGWIVCREAVCRLGWKLWWSIKPWLYFAVIRATDLCLKGSHIHKLKIRMVEVLDENLWMKTPCC